MHRLSLIIFVFLGFLILCFSLFSQTRPSFGAYLAQEDPAIQVKVFESSPSGTEFQPAVSESSYYLAYPGILPDNPFYWLKMVRDRIKLWTTNDHLAKTQLLILYADKRIGAAQALVTGGKTQLSETTATKAELYLKQASDLLQAQDSTNQDTKNLWQTLNQASQKHLEILNLLKTSLPDNLKSSIDNSIVSTTQVQEDSNNTLKSFSN